MLFGFIYCNPTDTDPVRTGFFKCMNRGKRPFEQITSIIFFSGCKVLAIYTGGAYPIYSIQYNTSFPTRPWLNPMCLTVPVFKVDTLLFGLSFGMDGYVCFVFITKILSLTESNFMELI